MHSVQDSDVEEKVDEEFNKLIENRNRTYNMGYSIEEVN